MCSPFRVSKLPQDVVSCCSLRLHFRDVSTVAKCSVKSNSQVDWGWSMFQFLSTPLYVQLSVRFSVPEVEYACLCLVWVGTQMVLLVVVANAV